MKYKFQQGKINFSITSKDASMIFRIHLLIVYSYSWKIRISIPSCNKMPQCHMILSLPSRRKPFYGQVFFEKLLKSNLKSLGRVFGVSIKTTTNWILYERKDASYQRKVQSVQ